MSKWKIDDWVKTRKHGKNFSDADIALIAHGYQFNRLEHDVARQLGCSSRNVYFWYRKFRLGIALNGKSGVAMSRRQLNEDRRKPVSVHRYSESCFTGPVPKRPVPPPNVMPGIRREQLVAGR